MKYRVRYLGWESRESRGLMQRTSRLTKWTYVDGVRIAFRGFPGQPSDWSKPIEINDPDVLDALEDDEDFEVKQA